MSEKAKKIVTSLLFSSVMSKDIYDKFVLQCDDLVARAKYAHLAPQPEFKELNDGRLKCIFNFTEHLNDGLPYDAALTQFLASHERFICDILSISHDVSFQLSALINIDEDVEVFDIKSPRFPDSINAFPTFEFDYWIWHLRGPRPERP